MHYLLHNICYSVFWKQIRYGLEKTHTIQLVITEKLRKYV